jgi:hypothetical protein
MKVVGVGLNKTGTTSLGACLQHWGFKHISVNRDAFRLYLDGKIDALLRMAEQYDSFEDWPWPLIYREIDRAFPGSKFILTRRKDAESWFRSLCDHAELHTSPFYRKPIYGYAFPHRYKEQHIRFYNEHNRAVREYFSGRPGDLLEVCWGEGHGWDELASFLGRERPAIPFPHLNSRPRSPVARLRGRLSRFRYELTHR